MHQLPPGRIAQADRCEDRPSAAGRPRKGWPRRAHAAVPDLPSGDEYRRRVRTGRLRLGTRALVDALGRQDEGGDLKADEGPERNGGRRTGEEVVEHMKSDPLVFWAWSPGAGDTTSAAH